MSLLSDIQTSLAMNKERIVEIESRLDGFDKLTSEIQTEGILASQIIEKIKSRVDSNT